MQIHWKDHCQEGCSHEFAHPELNVPAVQPCERRTIILILYTLEETVGLVLLPTFLTSPPHANMTLIIQVENKVSSRSSSKVKTLTCKLSSNSGSCCWQDATIFSRMETLPWQISWHPEFTSLNWCSLCRKKKKKKKRDAFSNCLYWRWGLVLGSTQLRIWS